MPIVGIDGIYLGDGNGGKISYDIISGKVLEIISSNSLGIAGTALIENPGQVRAGTVVYRKPELIKTGDFAVANDAGAGGIATQTPQVETVLVNIDKRKAAKYKIDEFDIVALQDAAAIEAQIAAGLAKSTMARLDLELFENVKQFLKDNESSNTITIADFSTTTDLEQMRLNRLKFNDLVADIESTITKDILGTPEFETVSILSKKAYGRMLEGIAFAGGDRGTELRLQGQLPGQVVGGNAILKHIFVAKKVDGKIFTLDKVADTDYDFSKIEAFLWNREAIAFPFQILGVTAMRDYRDGDPIFIQKFRYGFKVLRKELIRGILNATLAARK